MSRIDIPLSAPDITEIEIEAVVSVLRGSRLSLGPKMEEFEHAFAAYAGAPHAVAVSSGTAALHLSLLALGVGPGDEVIVPSFTFVAVANAVRYVGAVPVFADIDPDSLNLAPPGVEAAVTARTRALIAVHTFGRPADMAALRAIADRHDLLLIEDACEAIGAEIAGQRVGSFGDTAVFAFYPNKQITTGEGGMVTTRAEMTARRARILRNHGRCQMPAPAGSEGSWLDHSEVGYNYRISEIQCALGLVQLGRVEEILSRRADIARRYRERLNDHPQVRVPILDAPGRRLSWFVFVVRLAETFAGAGRDRIGRALAKEGIATGRYFAPIHLQPAYAAWREAAHLPVTETVAGQTLALPFFNRISVEEIERVCAALRAALEGSM